MSTLYKLGIWISNLTATAVAGGTDATLQRFYLFFKRIQLDTVSARVSLISSLDAMTCNFTVTRFAVKGTSAVMLAFCSQMEYKKVECMILTQRGEKPKHSPFTSHGRD